MYLDGWETDGDLQPQPPKRAGAGGGWASVAERRRRLSRAITRHPVIPPAPRVWLDLLSASGVPPRRFGPWGRRCPPHIALPERRNPRPDILHPDAPPVLSTTGRLDEGGIHGRCVGSGAGDRVVSPRSGLLSPILPAVSALGVGWGVDSACGHPGRETRPGQFSLSAFPF